MRLRAVFKPLLNRLVPYSSQGKARAQEIATLGPARRWLAAQEEEIRFWNDLLGSTEMPRMNRNRPLQPYLTELITGTDSRVEILDVGAGPATILGDQWAGRDVHITAIDANATEFDHLLAKYGITPPCRTRLGFAEDLANTVAMSFFDLVHARNCIDHCKDPIRAIDQMVCAVKPGCCVFLSHYISEGRRAEYAGPHQWNLFPRKGRFYVDRPGMKPVDIGSRLNGIAEVSIGSPLIGPESFTVTIRRREEATQPEPPVGVRGARFFRSSSS